MPPLFGSREDDIPALVSAGDVKRLAKLVSGGVIRGIGERGLAAREQLVEADPAPLIKALQDSDKTVRMAAAGVLKYLRDPAVVSALVAALGDEDPRVRSVAASSLGSLGDPQAAEPLATARAHDSDEGVQMMARIALRNLGLEATQPPVPEGSGAVVQRLDRVPEWRPTDRARVESALADHLEALGLNPRPVRWVQAEDADPVRSAHAGFIESWKSRMSGDARPGPLGGVDTLLEKGASDLSRWLKNNFGSTEASVDWSEALEGKHGMIPAAEKEETAAAKHTKREFRTARDSATRLALGASPYHPTFPDLAIGAATHDCGIGVAQAWLFTGTGQQEALDAGFRQKMAREARVADASLQAKEAAGWLASGHLLRAAGQPAEAVERLGRAYLPLVDAVEAGLWLFWPTPDAMIAVPTPDVEWLKRIPLFNGLSDEQLRELGPRIKMALLDEGDMYSDPANEHEPVVLILEGTADIVHETKLGELSAGEVFGAMAPIAETVKVGQVTATSPMRLIAIDRYALDAVAPETVETLRAAVRR